MKRLMKIKLKYKHLVTLYLIYLVIEIAQCYAEIQMLNGFNAEMYYSLNHQGVITDIRHYVFHNTVIFQAT